MKKNFTLALIALSLPLICVFGQNDPVSLLKGKIQDSEEKPIEFAVVRLLQEADSLLVKGVISDEKGAFELKAPAGRYILEARSLGYTSYFSGVFGLEAGEERDFGNLRLNTESQQIAAVEVKARRPLLDQRPDMTVMNIKGTVMSQGASGLEILRMAPGVLVNSDGRISMNSKAGLIIMIDGKTTNLTGRDLAMVLQSIPAENIDKIEIITNPSARYDASGSAGIINIKLNRDQTLGTTGTLQARVQRDAHYILNSSAGINHRSKNLNLYGTVFFSTGSWLTQTATERVVPQGTGSLIFDQQNDNLSSWVSPSYRVGADYFLNSRSTLGFLSHGFYTNNDLINTNVNAIRDPNQGVVSNLSAINDSPYDRFWNLMNANYRYEDSLGNVINIDVDHGVYKDDRLANLQSQLTDQSGATSVVGGNIFDTQADISLISVKGDYIKRLSKNTKVEGGVKFSKINNDNAFVAQLLQEQVFIPDAGRTNWYLYQEEVAAGYASFNTKFGKWAFQAGLRAENTNVKGRSRDLFDKEINQPDTTYLNLFPSAFLTFEPGEDHQLRASYSRRITRPDYSDMNPFEYLQDPFTVQRGNPFLRPQFADSYEFSYTYLGEATLSVAYSETRDLFSSINLQEEQRLISIPANAGQQRNWNFNLSLPVPINDWWSGYVWVGVFHNDYEGLISGVPVAYRQWGVNNYVSSSFNFKAWTAEISGWYNSPAQNVIFQNRSNGSLDINIGRRLRDGAGYIGISYNDLLATQRQKNLVDFNGISYTSLQTFESQSFSINFFTKIGNTKVKGSRERETASQEELLRADQ